MNSALRRRPVLGPLLALAPFLALLLAACGSSDTSDGRFIASDSDAPFVPVLVSSDTATGDVRLVLTLRDRNDPPSFATGTTFRFRYLDAVELGFRFRSQAPAETVSVDGETFYVAPANFDRAGFWAIEVVATTPAGDRLSSGRLLIEIDADYRTPRPGDAAIASPTLTLQDGPLAEITSDPDPDPALYQTSIAEALETGRPFVVVFTTVGQCFGSALCRRAVDQVGRLAAESGVLGIHAEPFETGTDGPPLPSTNALLAGWVLQNDPWIFVVDVSGQISASFEVVVSDAELSRALQAVALNEGAR